MNYLVASVHYQGISVPVVWECLDKKGGNSNADERISLMEKLLKLISPSKIEYVTADREFIGKEWISWLVDNEFKFRIRIKSKDKILFKNKEIYTVEVLVLINLFGGERSDSFMEIGCMLLLLEVKRG